MLHKPLHDNRHREDAAAAPTHDRERDGHVLLRGGFAPHEAALIREDVDRVFREYPSDGRDGAPDPPRSEMFNRSSLVQRAVGNPRILESVEPLLGEDCHIIANTSWRNPADRTSASPKRVLQRRRPGGAAAGADAAAATAHRAERAMLLRRLMEAAYRR